MSTSPNALAAAWGQEITSRRQNLDLTRAQLAARLDVSRQMVRLWETGVHAPSSPMQMRLIDEVGVDLSRIAEAMKVGAA